ncbi:MAG: hypothetical protein WC998_02335 [Candidatus Paceibacterota bacterium]|jgi:hypothetical protein
MEPSREYIEKFKRIFKDTYDKELNDQEATDSARNLLGFFETLMKISEQQAKMERKVKKEPKGFHIINDVYNCSICGRSITGDESWYDRWGAKCLLCQKAVDDGSVPGFICKEKDGWYSMWSLKSKFGIKYQTVGKLVRQGNLKARIVLAHNSAPYEYVFLKKENPHLIDPDRKSPGRKSYDKHREKLNKIYIKEKMTDLKKELKKKV